MVEITKNSQKVKPKDIVHVRNEIMVFHAADASDAAFAASVAFNHNNNKNVKRKTGRALGDPNNDLCERGDKGFEGPKGFRGPPGPKGDNGPPFVPYFVDNFVDTQNSFAFDNSDIVDGEQKVAFPLTPAQVYGFQIKKHTMSSYGSLGTRFVLPDDGVYQYTFEIYVRNIKHVDQDITVAVPITTFNGSAVEKIHRVKDVGFDDIAKITGTGVTRGVFNSWDGSDPAERTFYVRVATGEYVELPDGSGMSPPSETQGLYHTLTLTKVSDGDADMFIGYG